MRRQGLRIVTETRPAHSLEQKLAVSLPTQHIMHKEIQKPILSKDAPSGKHN